MAGLPPTFIKKKCKYCRSELQYVTVLPGTTGFNKPNLIATVCPHCDVWPKEDKE